jgi:hypothetical protein
MGFLVHRTVKGGQMSLDVYLYGEEVVEPCECNKCGDVHMHKHKPLRYDANITHNLGSMAEAAGIYKHLWRPEELGITHAKQLIEPLTKGLEKLLASPETLSKHNAPNGWGTYASLVPFVERYLKACIEYPEATVEVSR